MKLRAWQWLIGISAVILVLGIGVSELHAHQDAVALAEQLRLARAEGIPTTPAELVAAIPTAPASENAAPYYRQLKGKVWDSGDPIKLGLAVTFHPTVKSRRDAQAYLDLHNAALKIVDRATSLPRCWFDRDWSSPAATVLPEPSDIQAVARIIALRASVAADAGDSAAALADVKRLFVMSAHLAEGRTYYEGDHSDLVYTLGLRRLAYWRFVYPANSAYREAFERLLLSAPRPDLKRDHSEALVRDLSGAELFLSAEGRKKLGLKPGDENYGMKILNQFKSQPKARVEIVKAEREYWAALDHPTRERGYLEAAASAHLDQALSAFVTISPPSEPPEVEFDREATWEARQIQYKALLRALSGQKPARSIKTSDLLSPFDGTPVRYSFDGKQVIIEVSGYVGGMFGTRAPISLKIPPYEALKP